MNKIKFEIFAQQVRLGNEEKFNVFVLEEYDKCNKAFQALIPIEEERHDIILDAIYKFRKEYIDQQRLVISSNSSSYIYMIAKNMWFEKLRKRKVETERYKVFSAQIPIVTLESDQEDEEEEKNKMKRLLYKAMEQLPKSCNDLITQHKLEGAKLKDLWESLGYASYGACRKKHHKCKLKLFKLITTLEKTS